MGLYGVYFSENSVAFGPKFEMNEERFCFKSTDQRVYFFKNVNLSLVQ